MNFEGKKSDNLLKRNFDQLSTCPTYNCFEKQGRIKHSQGFQNGNIPFVENCPDVTNCDLLGHCISLGQDKGETLSLGCIPCREDQDGQGGLIYQGHEGERKWGRSSNHFQCIKDTKLPSQLESKS